MIKNKYILILCLAIASVSCTKIIDVDLNEADSELVIEAKLRNGVQDFNVRVSRSGAYFGSNTNPTISNATITLSDDQGNLFPVPSIGDECMKHLLLACPIEITP